MTYALITKDGSFFNRVVKTSYHAAPNPALYDLARNAIGDFGGRNWHTAECWEVLPGPMGLPDKKIKRKWKLKRDV